MNVPFCRIVRLSPLCFSHLRCASVAISKCRHERREDRRLQKRAAALGAPPPVLRLRLDPSAAATKTESKQRLGGQLLDAGGGVAEAGQEEGHELRVALQRSCRQANGAPPRREEGFYLTLEQVPDRCCPLTKT